jgi:Domain of unknown function (DUF4190)/zinc-ribbon domain
MYCWRCGNENKEASLFCTACGASMRGGPPGAGHDTARELRFLLPVNTAPLALTAGYLGLFSILLVPGPVAVLVGILALVELHRQPDRYGRGRAWCGVVMGVLGTAGLVYLLVR